MAEATTTMTKDSQYVRALWRVDNKNLMRLFAAVKFYGIDPWIIKPLFKRWHTQQRTDVFIINELSGMVVKGRVPGPSRDRGASRSADVAELLARTNEGAAFMRAPGAYVDIGAGDGTITRAIGASLGVDGVHAVDIAHWSNKENKNPGVRFQYVEPDVEFATTYADDAFGLVTVFQTLHHVREVRSVVEELFRITKPGGVVIIREHDASSASVRALCHLEHLIYGVLADGQTTDEFLAGYYGAYDSSAGWDALFEGAGFASAEKKSQRSVTRYYYAVYVKPAAP